MDLSENEQQLGQWLDRPYLQLALTICVILLLTFLAVKSGIGLWFLATFHLSERLVNEAGDGPDFWTIGSQLSAYKDSQVPGMLADAKANAAGKERFLIGAGTPYRREYLSGAKGSPAAALSVVDQVRLAAILA